MNLSDNPFGSESEPGVLVRAKLRPNQMDSPSFSWEHVAEQEKEILRPESKNLAYNPGVAMHCLCGLGKSLDLSWCQFSQLKNGIVILAQKICNVLESSGVT